MVLQYLRKAVENAVIIPTSLLFLAVIAPVLALWKTFCLALFYPFANVSHRVVVITGASSGIGQHLAYEYAKRGTVLMLAARRVEKLREVAEECRKRGAVDVAICRTDVSKEDDCKHLIDETIRQFGVLDVLVNNAGTGESGLFEEYESTEKMRFTVDVDFYGNVWPTLYALPHLKETRGQIVVTASVGAYTTYPRQTLYNASKAAILQFYDTLRVEVGKEVTVTIVLPGFITSELTSKAPSEHIPWWWPMMGTEEAARQIVNKVVCKTRYVVVPFWYLAWLPYRILASDYVDWVQRMLLLGQPPTTFIKKIVQTFFGEKADQQFGRLSAVGATAKGH